MTSTLVTNIGELVTNDPSQAAGTTASEHADAAQLLGLRHDAALVVEDGLVAWIGDRADAPDADQRIDAGGAAVLPGFVDSHAHLVFEGDRSAEFAARMTGEPYDGGGIATTMRATREATDDELRTSIGRRMDEMRAQGTTCVEIKSGYGLDLEQEERALRLAREFTPETTYLGAHVVPPGTDRRAYLDLVTGDMLAACAPYARWVDVFCEPHSSHAFDGDETREVLEASVAAGLAPRLHAGQLGEGPGVQIGVQFDAASVDHCTYLTAGDIEALSGSSTVATLLPGVEFSTRSPYPDARGLIDAGVTVALATDCNPGTCYSTSMPLMIALAVREMGMTPAEALWGATAGGAKALRRDDVGSLRVGMRADLAILDAPSYLHLCYRPGVPLARNLAVS